ncbi:MAG: ATP-binding protein [Candidatus Aenigmarchaeota archaeon]|nr:ATP-binding protein [Candidatus Aenigmarchaeota archaeon]
MEEKDIIRVIGDMNLWGREIDTGIYRQDYVERVVKFAGSGEIVAVVGPRRSGKTTICLQALKEMVKGGMDKTQTLYVNFEDPALETILTGPEAMETIYRSYKMLVNRDKESVLVLDEVQNVPKWEKWVRKMQDRKETKIIVTGSTSKLLSSEISTVLTGRTLSVFVFPLGFRDFLKFRGVEVNKEYESLSMENELNALLREYMEFGGFPKVAIEKDKVIKKMLLKEYFDGIIFRDIVQRYKIKDVVLIRNLAELCINQMSSMTSATKMREVLIKIAMRKISGNRVVNYMSYLENCFLVFFVPIFSYKVKNQKLYPKKAYSVDTGIANSVAFRFSEDVGRAAENLVFTHLKKLSFEKNFEIFYWKDSEQSEVDFVVKRGLNVESLFQVCWDIRDAKTKEREIKAITKAMDAFKLANGTVITGGFEGEEEIGNKKVQFVPIWKFLLGNFV